MQPWTAAACLHLVFISKIWECKPDLLEGIVREIQLEHMYIKEEHCSLKFPTHPGVFTSQWNLGAMSVENTVDTSLKWPWRRRTCEREHLFISPNETNSNCLKQYCRKIGWLAKEPLPLDASKTSPKKKIKNPQQENIPTWPPHGNFINLPSTCCCCFCFPLLTHNK